MTNWIRDLLGQRLHRDGTELLPTKKDWNFVGGLNASYNSATDRVDITLADGGKDWQESCRVATTVNLVATRTGNTLTATGNGNINTLGGIDTINTIALNDRVLVKNQAIGADNGIFIFTDLGTVGTPWVQERDILADETGEITPGMRTVIEEGAASQHFVYQCTNTGTVTMNATALTFATAGSLLALVTQITSGAVNATGATANAILQAGAPTVGGAWETALKLGTTPATAGDIRGHDTVTFTKWGTGPVVVPIIEGHTNDDVSFGLGTAAGANPPNINVGANSGILSYINGNVRMVQADAYLELGQASVRFEESVASPAITHRDDATPGVSGDLMTWEAQGVTDPAGAATSGDSLIRGGRGTVHGGNLDGNVAVHEQCGNYQSGEEVVFISDAVTAPVAAAAAGAFLWSEGALLHAYHYATPATGYARFGLVAGSGVGVSAASQGHIRLQDDGAIIGRRSNDAGDRSMLWILTDNVYFGGQFGTATRPADIIIDAQTDVLLQVASNNILSVSASVIEFGLPTARFDVAVVSPSLGQELDPAAGVTGDDLTAEAQGVSDPAGNADAGDFGITGGKGTVHANNLDGNVWVHTAPGGPGWNAMEMGVFVGDCVTPPAGNPAAGGFLFSNFEGVTGLLGWHSPDGATSTVGPAIYRKRTVVNFGMTPYAVATTDYLLGVTTAGGALQINLPAAAGMTDRHLFIKDEGGVAGGAAITIDANGGEFIDGQLTAILNANYASIHLYCDGVGWFIY